MLPARAASLPKMTRFCSPPPGPRRQRQKDNKAMGWNRKAWGPVVPRPAPADMWRVAMGSIVGMGLATALVWLAHAGTWDLPLRLFAPLGATAVLLFAVPTSPLAQPDRKSTRLNSSHSQISYAVFCLKKKKTSTDSITLQRP